MRRSIVILLVMGLWAWPWSAGAGILEIQLDNGNVIRSNQIWEEGNTIYFFTAEGKVGISKSLVTQIREIVAREDFASIEESSDLRKLTEICKEGEVERAPMVVWSPLYQWMPPAEMSVVDNDQGPIIAISGRVMSGQKEKKAESLVFRYRDRLKDVIDVKTVVPTFKSKDEETGVNEFTVSDSVSATLCPRDVEVSVIRYVP